MAADALSLARALGVGAGSCVAIIGAGGKTTSMLALAADLQSLEYRVVVTTTTKIWAPADLPTVLEVQARPDDRLRSALRQSFIVAWGHHVGPEGKLHGVTAYRVCRLLASGIADVVICEADGAAGRSLKAHGAGEPVVPPCATQVVVVAGMDALGRSVDDATVHRVEVFCRVTGSRPGDAITARLVARALRIASQHAPVGAGLVYLLNKIDGSEIGSAASQVAEHLKTSRRSVIVVPARWGRPIRPAEKSPSPSLYSE